MSKSERWVACARISGGQEIEAYFETDQEARDWLACVQHPVRYRLEHRESWELWINLTPHPVVLIAADGTRREFPSKGSIRLTEIQRQAPRHNGGVEHDGVPILEVRYECHDRRGPDHDPLPIRRPGVKLIVSQIVANAFPDRTDLVFPVNLVRDAAGRIIGCQAFGRPPIDYTDNGDVVVARWFR